MKVEKLEKSRAKITFDVTPEEFEHGLDHAFEHAVKEVTVKGFRKGKVPRAVYETNFGVESLYDEALNHLFGHKFDDALRLTEVEIVSNPKVVDFDITKIERGKSFTFAFEVAVRPDVVLGTYKGLEVKKENVKVTAKEIDQEVTNLLNSDSSVVEKPADSVLEKGDIAIFDFEGFKDGVPFEGGKAENYELEIGSNQFIPGFEEQMLGMKTGEERELNVTFPKDYHAENLKGAAVIFKVKLHEIKVKTLPQLTDEWVKSLKREGIETIDDLKADIKNKKTAEKESAENNRIIEDLVGQAAKNATVAIPVEMIDREKEVMRSNVEKQASQYGMEFDMFLQLTGTDKETFDIQISEAAAKRVLETLVLQEIAKVEKFTYSQEQIESKYQEIADTYKMDLAEVKKYLSEDVIKNELDFNRAIDFLKEAAKKI